MSDPANKSASYTELKWHQRLVLTLLAFLMTVWSRTLCFRWGPEVQAIINEPPEASVIILWHNRLFSAPEFFRRNFSQRRLATLISASGDGAWLAAFLRKLGMFPIRGSHYKRGPQAVREMLAAHKEGYDIVVTPDGSRGPMYDLKPGAVAVALKTGAPFAMFSLNFSRAWRLKSWDRFYLPLPFSRIEVQLKVIEKPAELGDDPREVAGLLKAQMDAITVDET
ncbi:MAG: lysophospholipid acyltransferase family protein [Opitutales bacterium]